VSSYCRLISWFILKIVLCITFHQLMLSVVRHVHLLRGKLNYHFLIILDCLNYLLWCGSD
jgi:hypothetical protein